MPFGITWFADVMTRTMPHTTATASAVLWSASGGENRSRFSSLTWASDPDQSIPWIVETMTGIMALIIVSGQRTVNRVETVATVFGMMGSVNRCYCANGSFFPRSE